MKRSADIFLGGRPSRPRLREAIATTFHVPLAHVQLREIGASAHPVGDVVFEYFDTAIPGDYPLQFLPLLRDDLEAGMPAALSRLAEALGLPVLGDAGIEHPTLEALYLPDGSTHLVYTQQDDDARSAPPGPPSTAAPGEACARPECDCDQRVDGCDGHDRVDRHRRAHPDPSPSARAAATATTSHEVVSV